MSSSKEFTEHIEQTLFEAGLVTQAVTPSGASLPAVQPAPLAAATFNLPTHMTATAAEGKKGGDGDGRSGESGLGGKGNA